jgi:hypothetical protein
MNSCLLYRPGKGRNSIVEFDCSLDGRVWVKGSIKGRTEEGPVSPFIIIEHPGCGEIWMEVNFEHYRIMVR